jgi:hypothetical protein
VGTAHTHSDLPHGWSNFRCKTVTFNYSDFRLLTKITGSAACFKVWLGLVVKHHAYNAQKDDEYFIKKQRQLPVNKYYQNGVVYRRKQNRTVIKAENTSNLFYLFFRHFPRVLRHIRAILINTFGILQLAKKWEYGHGHGHGHGV